MMTLVSKQMKEGITYNAIEFDEDIFKNFIDAYVKEFSVIDDYSTMICSFDTETTSTLVGRKGQEEPFAFVYIWMMAFGNTVFYGRYLEQFFKLLQILSATNDKCTYVIWVHNLPYDWYFIKNYIEWEDCFFIRNKKPMYTRSGNIEFRCSLILSGKSLKVISEEEIKDERYGKKSGDLDYDLVRLPITPLTPKELEYCYYDVLTTNEYINEYAIKNEYTSYKQFPYTKTGKIRKRCRYKTSRNKNKNTAFRYQKIMQNLTLTTEEYQMLHHAFRGGFTNGNPKYAGKLLQNVGSFDISSSYPSAILLQKFPMSKGIKFYGTDFTKEALLQLLKDKLVVFKIRLFDVKSKINFEHFWPASDNKTNYPRRILDEKNNLIRNKVVKVGKKLASADCMQTVMTNVDFWTFVKCYDFSSFEIIEGYYYEAGYLPYDLVDEILNLYHDKTFLKGVEGEENRYQSSKEDINGVYGMMVTDIDRIFYIFDNYSKSCVAQERNTDKSIDKYNKDSGRFLNYAWGVFVTAYARQRLWNNILLLGDNYIYADTDSTKFIYSERLVNMLDKVNEGIMDEIRHVSKVRNIPIERFMPKDQKGIEHPIGVWEYEKFYYLFKYLSPKRYLSYGYSISNKNGKHVRKGGTYMELTCAGWNKEKGLEYFSERFRKDRVNPFNLFNIKLRVPAESSGTTEHFYHEPGCCTKATIRDEEGRVQEITSLSWIYIRKSDYSLHEDESVAKFLASIDVLDEGV